MRLGDNEIGYLRSAKPDGSLDYYAAHNFDVDIFKLQADGLLRVFEQPASDKPLMRLTPAGEQAARAG